MPPKKATVEKLPLGCHVCHRSGLATKIEFKKGHYLSPPRGWFLEAVWDVKTGRSLGYWSLVCSVRCATRADKAAAVVERPGEGIRFPRPGKAVR